MTPPVSPSGGRLFLSARGAVADRHPCFGAPLFFAFEVERPGLGRSPRRRSGPTRLIPGAAVNGIYPQAQKRAVPVEGSAHVHASVPVVQRGVVGVEKNVPIRQIRG